MFRKIPALRIRGTTAEPFSDEVMVEIPLTIQVNGRSVGTAMTSPVDLPEFVTGFLFTTGTLGALSELVSLEIDGETARVVVKQSATTVLQHKADPACAPRVPAETIIKGLFEVLESELHNRTGGAQAVGLIVPPAVVYRAEDIGRHNALDRVIGFGLMHNIDFRNSFVVCSGRISAAMARKCVIAGIPVAATRGATTTEAIRVATEGDLTIIGFVRRESMNVYTGRHRIEWSKKD